MGKKFYILDNFLENTFGHYYEYDKSVKKELIKKGFNVKIFANINVSEEIKKNTDAIPFFPQENNITRIYKIKILSFIRKYGQIFKESDSDTVLFLPQIAYSSFIPLVLALIIYKHKFKCLVLFYRYSYKAWKSMPPTYWFGFTVLKILGKLKSKKIKTITDSTLLKTECEEIFSINCTVLPIPHTTITLKDQRNIRMDDGIILYAPGPSRLNKGLDIIVGAIEKIHKDNSSLQKKLIFVLQHDASINSSPTLQLFIDRLKKISPLPNLEIKILSSLSSEDYHSQLACSDIILLPYQSQAGYDLQTSGIFTESISIGKPVIVSPGTWMSNELKINNLPGEVMFSYTAESLVLSIMKMINDLDEYKNKCMLSKSMWNHYHNPKEFCEKLVEISS